MCIHCYGVPRCFKNGIRKAAAKYKETVLRCGNTGCQSEFLVINSMRGLIEDVQHEIWRSLPCNWHHSMTAEEMNEGYSIGKRKSPAPITHLRFDDTKCYTCGQFVTPHDWHHVGPGLFQCSLGGPSCANIHCRLGHLILPVKLDSGFNDFVVSRSLEAIKTLMRTIVKIQ